MMNECHYRNIDQNRKFTNILLMKSHQNDSKNDYLC